MTSRRLCELSILENNSDLLRHSWRSPGGKQPLVGVGVFQSSRRPHIANPVKRGFTLGKEEKKNPRKWKFLFSSVLVFVLLLPSCMLNETRPKKFVEIFLCLRKKALLFFSQLGSDLLGCIQMTIYNCKTFQNLPSSQLDTTSSAETGIYTPSPWKCGIKHFS